MGVEYVPGVGSLRRQLAAVREVAEDATPEAIAVVRSMAVTAQAAADNARQMVLSRDPRLRTLEDVAEGLSDLATSYEQALIASQVDRRALHEDLNELATQLAQVELTPGPQGETGPKGDQGATGSQGPQGAVGERGPQGITGALGPVGPAGETGAKGDTGSAGAQGATGAAGLPGPQGVKGDTGATGAKGTTGTTGATGATGPQGPAGIANIGLGGGSAPTPAISLLGSTSTVVVPLTWSGTPPTDGTYQAVAFLNGGASLLGNMTVQGITAKTTTTVTVSVKGAALIGVGAGSIDVVAFKATTI